MLIPGITKGRFVKLQKFDVNGIAVAFTGDHQELLDLIVRELSLFAGTGENPAVIFNITKQRLAPDKPSSSKDGVFVGEAAFIKIHKHLRQFFIKIHGNPFSTQAVNIDVSCEGKYGSSTTLGKIREYPFRVLYSNYFSRLENLAQDFISVAFRGIMLLVMLQKQGAFLHASAVEKDGEATLFAGSGGTGKTSCCVRLVDESNYRFLSDDMTLINSNGIVCLYPKYINCFPYNLRWSDNLRSQGVESRPLFDKMHYKARSALGLRALRLVSPEKIWGWGKLGDRGHVSKVIHLVQGRSSSFEVKPAKSADLARENAQIFAEEFVDVLEILANWHLLDPSIPDAARVTEEVQKIYERAFSKAVCFIVSVPYHASFERSFGFVRQLVG